MALNQKLEIPTTHELFIELLHRDRWQSKTPYQKWCHLYGMGRSISSIAKYSTFVEDQTISRVLFIPVACAFFYFCMVIYTAVYYISNGEPFKCLPCTCILFGPVFTVKICSFVHFDPIFYENNMKMFSSFLLFTLWYRNNVTYSTI